MKRCKKPERKHLSTTIDRALYERLIPVIEKDWGGPFSSWLDHVATCYLQESCDDCSYAEEEGQKKAEGIGKILDEKTKTK